MKMLMINSLRNSKKKLKVSEDLSVTGTLVTGMILAPPFTLPFDTLIAGLR